MSGNLREQFPHEWANAVAFNAEVRWEVAATRGTTPDEDTFADDWGPMPDHTGAWEPFAIMRGEVDKVVWRRCIARPRKSALWPPKGESE